MANEDLLLRQMPHSLEGEQAVLGSMLIDADCVKDVMDKLRPVRISTSGRTGRFSRPSTPCSPMPSPSTALPCCEEMQKSGHLRREHHPFLSGPADGDHPHQRQRDGVRGHRPGQGAAAGAWPRPPRRSPPWCRRASARPPTFWRRRSRRFTPSAGASSAQDMVPLRQVLPEVLDRLGEMSRRATRPPAGALHGYVRGGPEDHGPEQIGPDPAGRPARHGQDLLCA